MLRIQKILCPVDFFPASEKAAEYAIALAARSRARLVLLHVVEHPATWAYDLPMDTSGLMKTLTTRSTAELKRIAKRAEAANVPVEAVVREGETDDEIRTLATKQKVDLVIMGTHGRRGLERFFIGSKTERLLRTLPIPLLTISSNVRVTPAGVKNILVTTDFSEGTAEAVDYALSIGRRCRAQVTLLHVLDDVQADVSGRYRDILLRSIRRDLENLVPPADIKSCPVAVRVDIGIPIRRILPLIKKEKFDLIVMNIHGKTMLDRVTLGSTAEKIVRAAPIPVLVIPPKAAATRTTARKQAA